jgi:hypothetical protein
MFISGCKPGKISLSLKFNKDLKMLVAQVTPPAGRVAYVSKGNGKVVQVHKFDENVESSEVQYKYFVTTREFEKVQKMFFIAAPVPNLIEKTNDKKSEVSESDMDKEEENSILDTDAENSDDEGKCVSDTSEEDLMRQSSTSSTKYN